MSNTKEAKALPGQSSPSRQCRTQKKPRHCPDNLVHQGKAEHKRDQGIARTTRQCRSQTRARLRQSQSHKIAEDTSVKVTKGEVTKPKSHVLLLPLQRGDQDTKV
ncbi:unnamed protein product [Cochlearia groenlandica]